MHVLSRSEMVTESRGVGRAALGPMVPRLLTVEKKQLLLKRMALGEEVVIWKDLSGEVDLCPVVVGQYLLFWQLTTCFKINLTPGQCRVGLWHWVPRNGGLGNRWCLVSHCWCLRHGQSLRSLITQGPVVPVAPSARRGWWVGCVGCPLGAWLRASGQPAVYSGRSSLGRADGRCHCLTASFLPHVSV